MVEHITESLGYVPPCEPKAAEKSPPTPTDQKPLDPREKLLNTPAASAQSPVISPEYARIDGQFKAAEPLKDWQKMVDLSDIEDDDNRKRILHMLQRHEQMWSGYLGEIEGVSHRIELTP